MSAIILHGWTQGDNVVIVPNSQVPGEGCDHHITSREHYLPGGSDEGWKRWRYRSDIETLFWWESPTKSEKESTEIELHEKGYSVEHQVYVELHSSQGKRFPGTPKFNLDDLEDHGRDPGILDVTHYPDAPTDAMRHWLATIGDSLPGPSARMLLESHNLTWILRDEGTPNEYYYGIDYDEGNYPQWWLFWIDDKMRWTVADDKCSLSHPLAYAKSLGEAQAMAEALHAEKCAHSKTPYESAGHTLVDQLLS